MAPPVFVFPDFDNPFIVNTGASNLTSRLVLSNQKADGKIHPIQYASRTITALLIFHTPRLFFHETYQMYTVLW